MYDTIIIGGGIAGLYCALSLPHEKVLLLEASDYWGGRIKTHYNPQYEIGAGRFHKNHKRLFGLIDRFGLTPVHLPGRADYIDEDGLIPNVDQYMNRLIRKMKLKESMRNQTFFEYCLETIGEEDAHKFVHVFGFHEPYYKNAYDMLKSLKRDFTGDFYVLKEGMSELCSRMQKEIHGKCKLNHRVKSITREGIFLNVDGIMTKNVVVTIPPSLFHLFPILDPWKPIVSKLTQGPLLRIYAKYPSFPLTYSTTTDMVSRHIIPIRDGIVMIAYMEDRDIEPFLEKGKLKTEKEIRVVLKPIHRILKLEDPEWIKPYLWHIGTHAWLPGPREIPRVEGVIVCGEAFSERQSWVEGALESVEVYINCL
jgi:hypothetical protein